MSGSVEAYCVETGFAVRVSDSPNARCRQHTEEAAPCFIAIRDPRCMHPFGAAENSTTCVECGAEIETKEK